MSMPKKLDPPRWAVCGAGRIGRVTSWDGRQMFKGERLEGGDWQSKCPIFLHPDTQEVLEEMYHGRHV